ncbi:Asp-tRNA(Asn)/Glu-tRNA(Gln) amidotransferase subunit GatC [Cohnella lubricantis]|uniref:Aspartyl/glutamyl-tRNA(Asn/Gln) amidotransferase subunit C n=1 Tax=Cohnella lubricantis TaxID=2163172 RepID=A0A841T9G9_9BACL|nr:Asp-tRNA(Asn)/Glu-tRNA(Gln) amidotransferase subunit GatC [Cohnella lubricantis]MBB6677944.1 Asp-tRNA(Asn)/Glu-tRNA(Gln) amidotransferase subunit GatC [Cohnella lubricantis]MBP2119988.1 aspartyl-tRNA(Asn)/glutamyl-tRNA(Gln) amidotransferase subunit C [Cohnella lubricantis]
MSITVKDVEHVANLARLELSEAEKDRLAGQLSTILEYADKLNELDTNGIEPTSHVLPIYNVMREDEVRPSLSAEKALLNAPEEEDGHFRVPAVME